MIKLHFADTMDHTPFQEGPRRDQIPLPSDLTMVADATEADVIVARFPHLLSPHYALDRAYYVWTHEPAWCPVTERAFDDAGSGRRINVSSAWNGDVYLGPLYYFPFADLDREAILSEVADKRSMCVFLATYRGRYDRYRGRVNVDLCDYRQRLAMRLQRRFDACDIHGKSWPERVRVSGESRADRLATKPDILKPYRFNLALENTMLPNYVTEKLWDAIRAGCVPIYMGRGTGVGQVLSPGSYLDCSGLTADQLHDRMTAMTTPERRDMIGSALDDMARVNARTSRKEVLDDVVARFVSRVRDMV